MAVFTETIESDEERVVRFLRESNLIEGVTEDDALEAAKNAWAYIITQPKMTKEVIRETHGILMSVQSAWDEPNFAPTNMGQFRTCDVWIGGKKAVHPVAIENLLDQWCDHMNSDNDDWDDWKRLHVDYEAVHPFLDGNGRTGRIFMNWYRVKLGLPVLVIKAAERHSYYQWFR